MGGDPITTYPSVLERSSKLGTNNDWGKELRWLGETLNKNVPPNSMETIILLVLWRLKTKRIGRKHCSNMRWWFSSHCWEGFEMFSSNVSVCFFVLGRFFSGSNPPTKKGHTWFLHNKHLKTNFKSNNKKRTTLQKKKAPPKNSTLPTSLPLCHKNGSQISPRDLASHLIPKANAPRPPGCFGRMEWLPDLRERSLFSYLLLTGESWKMPTHPFVPLLGSGRCDSCQEGINIQSRVIPSLKRSQRVYIWISMVGRRFFPFKMQFFLRCYIC